MDRGLVRRLARRVAIAELIDGNADGLGGVLRQRGRSWNGEQPKSKSKSKPKSKPKGNEDGQGSAHGGPPQEKRRSTLGRNPPGTQRCRSRQSRENFTTLPRDHRRRFPPVSFCR
jgi:hypothetical protein